MTSSLSSSNQKVAVVTGSSSGIGYETSLTLARNGFLTYAQCVISIKEEYKISCREGKIAIKDIQ